MLHALSNADAIMATFQANLTRAFMIYSMSGKIPVIP
ncbi:hypothetical protein EW026_g8311 [Hermanssonia centrifuga]|uniref:Uncharacterized protein n=1 Tax=Hermanssonia centrifuga TaxID=98765 RepID=A0A4V3X935_9APHY|nr:hypothetical protein EW026_g8311 [Hermanssonia centrifuga]